MHWILPALVATITTSLVSSLLYLYLYSQDRKHFLLVWSISWAVYSFRFIFHLLAIYLGETSLFFIGQQAASLASAFFLIWGVYLFIEKPLNKLWILFAIACLVWTAVGNLLSFSFVALHVPVSFFLGIINIRVGYSLLKNPNLAGVGKKVAGWSFVIWGIHKADYPFLRPVLWFAPWGYLIASVLFLASVMGILLVYYEKVQASLRHEIEERVKSEEEKERIQTQLVQAQKMEAIGTLAGGLAHDFNNILGGIQGSLNIIELTLKNTPFNNHEKIIKYLKTANTATSRAAGIVKQLLTLSRKQLTTIEPVDMQTSLRNVLDICRNSFPKSIELDFRIPVSPLHVMGDVNQVEQVLLNLCVNASHAMTFMRTPGENEGGILKVNTDIIHPDSYFARGHTGIRENIDYLLIQVSDNGVGMSEEERKRIFEPFYTTKEQSQGTGLGMAVVYSIIRDHSGHISIYSRKGAGTTISIYLPLKEKQHNSNESKKEQLLIRGEGTVLVVDDEEFLLTIAREILEISGYDILTANSGSHGIDLFKQNIDIINAVLLDMSMPGMSGHDVYREMNKLRPEIPILITSGFAMDKKVQDTLSLGAKDFLQKPYTSRQLTESIKKVITAINPEKTQQST